MTALTALAIAVFGNISYHLSSRLAPRDVNPFVILTIAYLVAGIAAAMLALRAGPINWATTGRAVLPAATLGLSVLAIEGGFLIAYRLGAPVASSSLLVNACVAIALLLIALVGFGERPSPQAWIGLALVLGGVVVLATAKT